MEKLQWIVGDNNTQALLRAKREDVVFLIYYQPPDLNNTARWHMVIVVHGEIMKKTPPRLEPRSLMSEAENYEKWMREI